MMTGSQKYKYEVIRDTLRQEIEAGAFPGMALPREQELAARFGVSVRPVTAALRMLAGEGLVRRVKSKGTFVNTQARLVGLSRQVGVIIKGEGHFFDPLRSTVSENLIGHGYYPITLHGVSDGVLDDSDKRFRAAVAQLLNAPIRGVIVDGVDYYHFPFLSEGNLERRVIVNIFEAPGKIPGAAVLADYEQGMYLATIHLIRAGRQRIAMLAYEPSNWLGEDAALHETHPLAHQERGYQRALREHGLEADAEIIRFKKPTDTQQDSIDRLRGILTRHNRPTGLVAVMDQTAVAAMLHAQDLGLKVPEDLAVVGFYSTPWCEQSPVPLTSVSLNETALARRAVEILLADPYDPKHIEMIEPTLIIRESAG